MTCCSTGPRCLSDTAAAAALGSAFDHVFVDEYQDTNRLQAEILLALKPDGRGLTVVGDDAQAIYSFRAAQVRNILDFPGHFEPRAHIVTLEQNYRSTEPILVAANAAIGEARERFAKNLWTERRSDARPLLVTVRDDTAQADYVCSEVLAAREAGIPLKAQAVLFRAASHSAELELELTRRNVPFVKFGGLKFLEAAHVKDLLAILRFAENPRDRVAGSRVLQLLPGIGEATAESILASLDAASGEAAALATARVPRAAAEHWPAFMELFELLRRGAAGWPAEIEAARVWYAALPGAGARGCRGPRRRFGTAGSDGRGLSLPRELPDRHDPRSAAGDQRPGRGAAAGRGLPYPLDDPLGQRPGMAIGVRAELRGRLHSVRSRDRDPGRDRGGAAAVLRGDDAGEGCTAPDDAVALLHPWPDRARRQARLCGAHAVRARPHPRPVRAAGLGSRRQRGGLGGAADAARAI